MENGSLHCLHTSTEIRFFKHINNWLIYLFLQIWSKILKPLLVSLLVSRKIFLPLYDFYVALYKKVCFWVKEIHSQIYALVSWVLIDLHKADHRVHLIGCCCFSVSEIYHGRMLSFCMQSSFLKSVVCTKINNSIH